MLLVVGVEAGGGGGSTQSKGVGFWVRQGCGPGAAVKAGVAGMIDDKLMGANEGLGAASDAGLIAGPELLLWPSRCCRPSCSL